MNITLAKALKLKNRMTAKLNAVSEEIKKYNSIVDGQERPIDVRAMMERRTALQDALVVLKCAVNKANAPVQHTIYQLGELKDRAAFLGRLDTTNGRFVPGDTMRAVFDSSDVLCNKTAVLDYHVVQEMLQQVEAAIDAGQDRLDEHNHGTTIEMDVAVLDLLKG